MPDEVAEVVAGQGTEVVDLDVPGTGADRAVSEVDLGIAAGLVAGVAVRIEVDQAGSESVAVRGIEVGRVVEAVAQGIEAVQVGNCG
uniref:Nicotinate-nucleotide diphosphorylase (Carboxylating) n=1 Tax=Panagrellus redivivus TaxID=6233 RepID=A0A7E4VHS7_PANRE